MSTIDFFKFEDKDSDFPIYNNNPHIPKTGWIVLFIALIIGFIFMMGSKLTTAILSCLIPLIPLLYYLNWDYKLIFQKPKAKDIALAVALFACYILYAILMSTILGSFGITSEGLVTEFSLSAIVPLIFSIMGEELVKFIPFMFFLRLFFKYSNNRKLSVIASMIIIMVFFASIHAYDLKMFLFALAIQGFGSIFEFIGYIKTKNLLIPYTTHLCTDVFIYLLAVMSGV